MTTGRRRSSTSASKQAKSLIGKEVKVAWDDASCDHGMCDYENMADLWLVETRGKVVKETAKSIFLASETFPNDEGRGRCVTRIPRVLVKEITVYGG